MTLDTDILSLSGLTAIELRSRLLAPGKPVLLVEEESPPREVIANMCGLLAQERRAVFASLTKARVPLPAIPALIPTGIPLLIDRSRLAALDGVRLPTDTVPSLLGALFALAHARGFVGFSVAHPNATPITIDLSGDPRFAAIADRDSHTLDRRLAEMTSSSVIDIVLDLRHVSALAVGTNAYAYALARGVAAASGFKLRLLATKPAVHLRDIASVIDERELAAAPPHVFHRPAPFFDPTHIATAFDNPAHVAVTQLDLIAFRARSVFPSARAAAVYRATSRAVARAAQSVIAISNASRVEIARAFDIPQAEVCVTPMGIKAQSSMLPRESRRPFLLYVGTNFPHKNIEGLLAAFAQLRREHRELELLIAGENVWSDATAASNIGVRMLGRVSDDALNQLYRTATAFVFPSLYEGFGIPVLEAMSHGTPVAAFPLDTTEEIAGNAASFASDFSSSALASAIHALLDDWSRFSEAGRQRAAAFTWDGCVQATLAEYRRTVERPHVRSLDERRDAFLGSLAADETPGVRGAFDILKQALKRRAAKALRAR